MPIPLGVLAVAGAGAGGASNWISYFLGLPSRFNGFGSTPFLGTSIQTAKLSNAGVIEWQKQIIGGARSFWQIACSSDGSSAIYGYSNQDGTYKPHLVKRDSLGDIVWQRKLNSEESFNTYAMTSDSAGNYIATYGIGGVLTTNIAKWNSSGTLQWSKVFSGNGRAWGIASDSTDNYYIAEVLTSGNTAALTKINSSGTVVWQKFYGDADDYVAPIRVTVDSSDNIYMAASNSTSGGYERIVWKFNSSGTQLWQKKIAVGANFDTEIANLATDSDDNLYVSIADGQLENVYLFKFDSSGNLAWQRQIDAGRDYDAFVSINGQTMYFSFRYATVSNAGFMLALPTDGSKTDTYSVGGVNITYSVSTASVTTPSKATTTVTHTLSNNGYTDSASSLTDANHTATQTVLPI